jgi:tetratricopeptide (TPR) repeat protein
MKSFFALCLFGSMCLGGCVSPTVAGSPSPSPVADGAAPLIKAADDLQKDGRVNEARYAYNDALSKYPDNYTMLTNRASCEVFLADYDAAIADLTRARDVLDKAGKKKEAGAVRLDLALVYFKMKNYAGAVPVLDGAIPLLKETKQDALLGAAYIYRGTANTKLKKLDLAVADLGEAIKVEPDDPNAYAERSKVFEDQHKFGPAADDLEKAAKYVKDPETLAAIKKSVKTLRKKAR